MREIFHPTIDQLNLATILNALGDPVRLNILKIIEAKEEAPCAYCGSGMTKSALSHHFKVLRESGVINVRIEGNQRFLSIRRSDIERRFPGVLAAILANA